MQETETQRNCEKNVRIITEVSILFQKSMIFLSFLCSSSSSRKQKVYEEVSPQTSNHEQTNPHGLCTNPKAKPVPSSQQQLPVHLVKNTAYVGKIKHPPPLKDRSVEGSSHPKRYDTATDQEMSPAQPSSGEPTYSYLQQVPTSFDASNCEWESDYSKLSYEHMGKDPIIKNQART